MGYFGNLSGALDRLKAQEDAGVNLHPVEVDAIGDSATFERTLRALVG
jgi:hypothetical protein